MQTWRLRSCSGFSICLLNALRRCCNALGVPIALLLLSSAGSAALAQPALNPAAGLLLHVPAPDWRDQIIYFAMTDRFADGDASNNDQGAGEFDPADAGKYSGGDLRGVEQRLDYVRGLGVTALWLTPPVANLWWDSVSRFSGFHGYWASDFKAVDPHLGSLADYQRLSHRLHSAGMYLVQDIVVNHTADYFSYDGGWDPKRPERFFRLHQGPKGETAPTQWPFSLNDARNPAHRSAAVYHWTPDITDYSNVRQQHDFQMSGLDDLNTENPAVREALRDSYGHWIRSVGVDAFRVDTAFYVPPEFFTDFMYSRSAKHPGMVEVARQVGQKDFFAFGEGFGIDRPFDSQQARRIETYVRGTNGERRLSAMLNFPLYGSAGDVFARGRPPAELAYRIRSMTRLHRGAQLMPSFVDNHDVDRFLAGGTQAALQQNLLLLMTLPGIPVIYYGTEQGFTERRASMFAAGHQSGGKDHFDVAAPMYRFVQGVTALRRAHRLFSRGLPTLLAASATGPGVLAYRMQHGRDGAIVAFNTSDSETLLDKVKTGLAPGTVLHGEFALSGSPADLVVGQAGLVTAVLPPRAGQVWLVSAERRQAQALPSRMTLQLERKPNAQGDLAVSGTASAEFRLVVDGELQGAQPVIPGPDGRWQATVDTQRMIDPALLHTVVAWSPTGALSNTASFRVKRAWKLLADHVDPSGDDHGPSGRYVYPSDPGWRANRQLDILGVKAWGSGGALKLDVHMNRVTTSWNPPNGFDHVAFSLFIELPGRSDGATALPWQNAKMPQGRRWHYRLLANGWSNALFSAEGAGPSADGAVVTPAADIRVDPKRDTVSFTISSAALGGLKSLLGAKLYLSTWDYDGVYRSLTPEPLPSGFGGGDGAVDPLIMDDTPLIELRE